MRKQRNKTVTKFVVGIVSGFQNFLHSLTSSKILIFEKPQ